LNDHEFIEFDINGEKLKSVKGLPATIGQFDLNNFQKGKLIFISDKKVLKNDNLNIKVTNIFSKSGSSKVKNLYVKNNKLNIQIYATDKVRIVTGIPFQEGWKVISHRFITPINYGGWLSLDLDEGQSDLALEFSPYFLNNSKLPFILMYLNIVLFVLIVANRVKSAKNYKTN
jgi:hypothetical protein